MSIAVPPRKGLKAKRLAETNPDLTTGELAKLVGTNPGNVAKAMRQDHFGRDKPKSRAKE